VNALKIGNRVRSVLGIFSLIFCLSILPAYASQGLSDPVYRTTLDNGLKVILVKNALAPVATVMMNYRVGSNQDPSGLSGMAHAMEHMMFRGSPDLSAGQLANIVAELGGNFNAMTQSTATQFFLTVPVSDLDIALRIEAIRMKGILSTDELWNPERGAIGQEVATDLSDPEFIFYRELMKTMFAGTPYANTGLGSIESFKKTTATQLKQFHKTWYVPNNAVLVVVGNIDPGRTLESIRERFGTIPAKKLPPIPEVRLQPFRHKVIRLKTGNPYGLYILAFRMPGYRNSDYAASEVLSDVLGSTRGELYNLTVEGKAIMTSFEMMTFPDAGVGLAIAAFPGGKNPSALIARIKNTIQKGIQKGFSTDLIAAAKRMSETQAELQKNSVQGLAMAWSDAVSVQDRSSPDDIIKEIAAVTPSEVNRVARKYLRLDQVVEAVLVPSPSGNPVSGKRKGISETFVPKQEPQTGLPPWAKASLDKLPIPQSSIRPVVKILPNGLKIVFQAQNVSNTVNVYGHVKNNPYLQVPSGKEGLDQVMESLFSFGTRSLDRIDFQKALDAIGAAESAGSDFSLNVLTPHFERGVELLADNLLHPAFPQRDFSVTRKQVTDLAGGVLLSPDFLADRALKTALFPRNDPMLRHAVPKTVQGLNLRDVEKYHRSVFRPDMTTIVVIGNIDSERAFQIISRYFGIWTAEGKKPDVRLPSVPPNKPAYASVPDKSRVQTKVILAQTLGITRTHPDYYPLQLGNHVLGGGFYATRFYRDLRETSGLVYNVSALLEADESRAYYAVQYGSNPENVSRAKSIIEFDLNQMRMKAVNDDELQRAKALLLREIPLSEASVSRIASGFLERMEYGLPLNEPILAAHKYIAMTPEQVRAAFEKWFRCDDMVEITQGPLPK
jgi:zinc protease